MLRPYKDRWRRTAQYEESRAAVRDGLLHSTISAISGKAACLGGELNAS
jgi:hypothetical protein